MDGVGAYGSAFRDVAAALIGRVKDNFGSMGSAE